MTRPVVGVLALQGDVREHLAALEAVGARAVPVRRESELASVDGLVLPGGESTAISRLARIFGLLAPVREALAAGLPAYGSCAGMIMLADRVLDARPDHEGFGGLDITVRRNAFGRQVDSFEADLEVAGIAPADEPVRAVFIRAPAVVEAGPEVQVLARLGPERAGTIVAVRQGQLLATSFHPELTGDLRVHASFVSIVTQRRATPGKRGRS